MDNLSDEAGTKPFKLTAHPQKKQLLKVSINPDALLACLVINKKKNRVSRMCPPLALAPAKQRLAANTVTISFPGDRCR